MAIAAGAAAPIHIFPAGPLVALVGNPNAGKTALFNRLTGSRQKVANYAGVTVERKEGRLSSTQPAVRVLDLPGAYSLYPRSLDERVTADVLAGRLRGEKRPDLVVCVVDATNLRRHLRLVLGVLRQGLPVVVALNMVDRAEQLGAPVDADALARELGVPVVSTVAVRAGGEAALRELLATRANWPVATVPPGTADQDDARISAILNTLGLAQPRVDTLSSRIDAVVLHPVIGPAILAVLMFFVFQAVFAWAEAPMEAIDSATVALGEWVRAALPQSAGWEVLRSFLADGLIAGVGGMVVFLPQILILFFFILVLEESGYLPRAAFLLDRIMGSVGLSGRSFIPLLSSFACAIPGIMAARSIANPRDRLVTILIAPLMTCSARLPVYALLIGALIPAQQVGPGGLVGLQGLVLFALYAAGIVSALAVAWVMKHISAQGEVRMLMLELPAYHWPTAQHVLLGLWQRALIFLRRVGGVILALTLLLWLLASFPAPPPGATGPAIEYSAAGYLGSLLAVVFEPLGFNWQISIALVPGMAAREVVLSALATVYAIGSDDAGVQALGMLVRQQWGLATGLSLLAWFVFAPQCLSTLAVMRRETGGWRVPAIATAYLFALAYAAAFVTYRVTLALGG